MNNSLCWLKMGASGYIGIHLWSMDKIPAKNAGMLLNISFGALNQSDVPERRFRVRFGAVNFASVDDNSGQGRRISKMILRNMRKYLRNMLILRGFLTSFHKF